MVVIFESCNSSLGHFLLNMKIFLELKITNSPDGHGIYKMTMEECIVQGFKGMRGQQVFYSSKDIESSGQF